MGTIMGRLSNIDHAGRRIRFIILAMTKFIRKKADTRHDWCLSSHPWDIVKTIERKRRYVEKKDK